MKASKSHHKYHLLMQQVMKISNSPIFSTAITLHQNYQMGSLPPELHPKNEKKKPARSRLSKPTNPRKQKVSKKGSLVKWKYPQTYLIKLPITVRAKHTCLISLSLIFQWRPQKHDLVKQRNRRLKKTKDPDQLNLI